jgi:ATP-binding protein involved in chromosome partitioning
MQGISQVKNLIAIGAGKGGVGKSTVTVNLAFALQKMGFSVGICDLDLYGPSIGKMVQLQQAPTPFENGMLPAEGGGLKLLSMAYFQQGLEVNFVRAPIANGIVKQFLHLVEWGPLDYLLLDCPPGTSDIHMTLMQEVKVHGALLVTTPQQVALLDVRKAFQMFMKMNVPVLGGVENMSFLDVEGVKHFPFGKSNYSILEKEFDVELLDSIPIDQSISSQGDLGQTSLTLSLVAQKIFENIAKKIVEKMQVIQKIPSISIDWNKNWV